MIRGLLFDKDGTLFDFEATWNSWAQSALLDLARGDAAEAARLGQLIGFDTGIGRFEPDSPAIACSQGEIAELLASGLPSMSADAVLDRLNALAAHSPQVEAVPLVPLLARLRGMGLALGVATNDAEAPARAHLDQAGVLDAFDFIAGYDSGHGAKPGPGMGLAFAQAIGAAPETLVMVGDTTTDMATGAAAGMRRVAVETGMAGRAELEPHADVVFPDIGHLPEWLIAQIQ